MWGAGGPSRSVVSDLTPWSSLDCSPLGIFSGKNTGAGCLFLLQGIFLTQRWNPCLLCLLHCRQIFARWAIREAPVKMWKCEWLSRVRLFATPWTVACQAPLSMELSRQEYWSTLPCHSFLQGIFLAQASNPGLPHCRQVLYNPSHQGSP